MGAVRSLAALAPGPTYSSTATWKLLPPKPKLLTPARRGWSPPRIHGRASVPSRNGLLSRSRLGLGRSILMDGGSTPWRSAITALNSPAAPAAAFVWPICDFTEPSEHQPASLRPLSSNTMRSPPNSAASPALVPVPWASTSSTVSVP